MKGVLGASRCRPFAGGRASTGVWRRGQDALLHAARAARSSEPPPRGWRRRSTGKIESERVAGTWGRARGVEVGELGREAEVAEDALHDRGILDGRDEPQAAAARAGEDVDREHATQEVGPRPVAPWRCCGRRV